MHHHYHHHHHHHHHLHHDALLHSAMSPCAPRSERATRCDGGGVWRVRERLLSCSGRVGTVRVLCEPALLVCTSGAPYMHVHAHVHVHVHVHTDGLVGAGPKLPPEGDTCRRKGEGHTAWQPRRGDGPGREPEIPSKIHHTPH